MATMNDQNVDRPVRLVCFDLGGVLIRICRTWDEGCRAAGLDARVGADDPALVSRRRAVSQAYSLGRIDCSTCFGALAAATGGRYTSRDVQRIHDAWLLGEYPGVGEIIERLRSSPRVRTGILSNTNHRHWVRYNHAGRPSRDFPSPTRLQNRHASHIMGLAKPDVAIYRAFERSVGLRGGEILFFDDLEENTAAQIKAGLERHGVWRG